MARFSLRHILGLIGVLALFVMGFVLLRSRPSSSTSPTAVAASAARAVSSDSGLDEWAMEGHNPARTRARSTHVALPINRQREVRITNDNGRGSPVAIAKDTLLVEGDYRLRALDLRTGKERWSFEETGRYISPAAAGDAVFIRAEADNKGQIFALDLATGQQRWAFTPRRLSSAATGFWGGHLTSPVIADGMVFVGAGKELYALDADTGKVRWEYSGADYVSSSATVGDGRVFISDARNVYALEQQTGALAWQAPTDFSVYFSPIVANQTVYLTNGEKVLALATADGAKRWQTGFPGVTLLPGAAQGSRLFVKSTSTLYALDGATGKELWRFEEPHFVSFPAVAGDQLFAVTGAAGQSRLAVLDVTTGKELWSQPVASLASVAPIIAGQTLYVRTTDGRVLGLSN